MRAMIRRLIRKHRLGHLYRHIPESTRPAILTRTRYFDRVGPIQLPSEVGSQVIDVTLFYYVSYDTGHSYVLLTRNRPLIFTAPRVRISSNCFFAFMANSRRCDCRWQFDESLKLLAHAADDDFLILFAVDDHGKAIEGGLRGHALLYAMGQALKQDLVVDAYRRNGFRVDSREYSDIDHILRSLRIVDMTLLTNNPERVAALRGFGYRVVPLPIERPYDKYLSEELGMKKRKLGHTLDLDGFSADDLLVYGLSADSLGPTRDNDGGTR